MDAIQEIRKLLNGIEINLEYTDTYEKSKNYRGEPLDFGLACDEEYLALNKTLSK